MFKALVLSVVMVSPVSGQGASQPAKDTANVVMMSWRMSGAGVDDAKVIPGAYLGVGAVVEKSNTGAVAVGAAATLIGAIIPTPKMKKIVTDVIVGGDETAAPRLAGAYVGFPLFYNDINAKWGKAYRLVRLEAGAVGRFFRIEGREDVAGDYDLSDSVRMLQSKQGNWYLKLVKPLDPGRYAVVNLRGEKWVGWSFDVAERLTPQDSPSELLKEEVKK